MLLFAGKLESLLAKSGPSRELLLDLVEVNRAAHQWIACQRFLDYGRGEGILTEGERAWLEKEIERESASFRVFINTSWLRDKWQKYQDAMEVEG